MSQPETIEANQSPSMSQAVIESMDMLKNMAIGGIGEDGPTLEELDNHAETTGRSWDDDADYHTAQWAWRKLEQGLNSQNPTGLGTTHKTEGANHGQ